MVCVAQEQDPSAEWLCLLPEGDTGVSVNLLDQKAGGQGTLSSTQL